MVTAVPGEAASLSITCTTQLSAPTQCPVVFPRSLSDSCSSFITARLGIGPLGKSFQVAFCKGDSLLRLLNLFKSKII